MASKTDWMDFAHKLHKEREAVQDRMPPGVEAALTLCDYGHGSASFAVHLDHRPSECRGYGYGNTPAKALEGAKADLKKRMDEQARRPRVVGAEKVLAPAREGL